MEDKKYRVITIPVKESPREAEMNFEEIQKFVGGYVEELHLYDNIFALVDEEARLKPSSQPNRTVVIQEKTVLPLTLLNNFVLVHKKSGDYKNLTDAEVKEGLYVFRSTSQDATIFI